MKKLFIFLALLCVFTPNAFAWSYWLWGNDYALNWRVSAVEQKAAANESKITVAERKISTTYTLAQQANILSHQAANNAEAANNKALENADNLIPIQDNVITNQGAITNLQVNQNTHSMGILINQGAIANITGQIATLQSAIDDSIAHPPKRIILSNNSSDPDHDINSQAGIIIFSDFFKSGWGLPFTKKIDQMWMAGSGNGGLADSLIVMPETWYHYFALGDSSGTFVDYGFDTSLTAANLLSDPAVIARGISRYSRQGSVLTDADSNIRPFIQSGKFFHWNPAILNYNLSFINVPAGPTLRSISTPFGIVTKAKLRLNHLNSGAGIRLGMFVGPNETLSAPTGCPPCLFNFATGVSGTFESSELDIYTNIFSEIKEQWNSGGKAGIYTIYTVGYEDFNLL